MSRICHCRSRNGQQKFRYKSEEHARSTAAARGWKVDVFRCPNRQHTYHITHAKTETKENLTP